TSPGLARPDVPSDRPRGKGTKLYARDAGRDHWVSDRLASAGYHRPGWCQETHGEMGDTILSPPTPKAHQRSRPFIAIFLPGGGIRVGSGEGVAHGRTRGELARVAHATGTHRA